MSGGLLHLYGGGDGTRGVAYVSAKRRNKIKAKRRTGTKHEKKRERGGKTERTKFHGGG